VEKEKSIECFVELVQRSRAEVGDDEIERGSEMR
jgi:hypothetical protein